MVQGGGIYRLKITNDGLMFIADFKSMERPMYAAFDGDTLCVVLRAAEGHDVHDSNGLFQRYALNKDGSIGDKIRTPISSGGACPCYISSSDGDVYIANYVSGAVSCIGRDGRLTVVTHEEEGVGPNEQRQDKPHPHYAHVSPCGKYLIVCDLGLDRVFVYDRDLRYVSSAKVPSGDGARHAVFSKDGKTLYVANELRATVSRFAWSDGTLSYIDTVSCEVDYEKTPHNLAAAIRLSKDGKRLYISNRGEDTICVFRVAEDGSLSLLSKTDVGSSAPRDFDLTPDETAILSCNMKGDCVTLLSLDASGMPKGLSCSIGLPQPLCVLFDR